MLKEFSSFQKPPILSYKKLDSDKMFVGCRIKSQYDEGRIHINEKYNPQRIEHSERYLYGVLLNVDGIFSNFSKDLEKIKSIDYYSYNKILLKNNLSCEENFGYLEDGLYPIDQKHIQDLIPDFKYESFFVDDLESPIYQRIKCTYAFLLKPQFCLDMGSK